MKKLNIAGALVLVFGLVLSSGAIAVTADDEVTIRVMEMHEKSTSSVMNRIQLPDLAGEKVTEEANYRNRLTEHKGEGDKDWDRIREQEQSYDQEQNQERELDLVQDQIRDTEPDIANEQQTGNETGAGAK